MKRRAFSGSEDIQFLSQGGQDRVKILFLQHQIYVFSLLIKRKFFKKCIITYLSTCLLLGLSHEYIPLVVVQKLLDL